MDLSDLLKWIVPAGILFWLALGKLLDKEEPRPVRGPAPGPRPGGLPPAPRPPAMRLENKPQGPISPPEDVFVIRAAPVTASSRAGQARTPRKGAKPKPGAKETASKSPTGFQANLGHLTVQPPTTTAASASVWTETPAPVVQDRTAMLRSPERLREAFLAGIIFGQPVARTRSMDRRVQRRS